MFTGIVEELGEVVALEPTADAARLTVRGPLVVSDAAPRRLDRRQRRLPHGRRRRRRHLHRGRDGRDAAPLVAGRPGRPGAGSTSNGRSRWRRGSAATSCRATSTGSAQILEPRAAASTGRWCASRCRRDLARYVVGEGLDHRRRGLADGRRRRRQGRLRSPSSLIPTTLELHHARHASRSVSRSTSRSTWSPSTSRTAVGHRTTTMSMHEPRPRAPEQASTTSAARAVRHR